MAILRYQILQVFICLTFVTVTFSEIHRAKSNVQKNVGKSQSVREPSYVADDFETSDEEDSLLTSNKANMLDTKLGTWLCSIFGAMLVGLSGIFPLLVIPLEAGPALKHGAAAARLKLLLSFAVGGLLGDVFLHLLPEAWDHLLAINAGHDGHRNIGLWVIAGLLSFLIIEKMFAKEDEFEHLQDECEEAEEEEKLHASDYQCQLSHQEQTGSEPIYEKQTGSRENTSDCIANRTRQRTRQNYSQPLLNSQTGSNSNMRKNENNESVTESMSNSTNGILTRNELKSKLNNNTESAGTSNHKEKSNGAIVENPTDNTTVSSIKVSGYLNLAANVIDNFTHGLAVAGGFLVNSKVGFVTLFAILLHEIPHEIGDFAILLRSGFDRWKAAKAQVCTATSGVIGALVALTADSASAAGESTVWILPFTSGGFIYIALVTVVPDLLEERHPKESTKQILSLLTGIGAMYLVSCIH